QINFKSTRLVGEWIEGHNDGLFYLDEITILNTEECTVLPEDAQPITEPPTAPPTVSPNMMSCNFDNQDFCNWQVPPGDVKWDLSNSLQGTNHLGPIMDHTTGQGYFLTMTPKSGQHGVVTGTAKLISPDITTDATKMCLRFWYHMNGANVGTLSVHHTSIGKDVDVWSRKGFQSNAWLEAFIGVTQDTEETFVIEFVAVQGKDLLSNVAVDDILLFK
ncbi:unnamed protein product, partial [Meganyctiphanes norvegica]